MDDRITRLRTPSECDAFERNAIAAGRADLAADARRHAVLLRAAAWGAKTDAERECVAAVYAYERVLEAKKGRKQSASRTWPMIKEHGVIPAVERIVTRRKETMGYLALVEMGLIDYAFEAVVLRYPHLFSQEAVKASRERLDSGART